jgi:hypothetical protein
VFIDAEDYPKFIQAGSQQGTGLDLCVDVQIKKSDDEQQLVFGEVYAPSPPDSQNDFMSREEIQQMAYEFMRKGFVGHIDVNHTREESGWYVVESFIARDDDPIFISGAWVLGVKVPSPKIWAMIKNQELNGFSIDGSGIRTNTIIAVEVPEVLSGQTLETGGHTHPFVVSYNNVGDFVGGTTLGPSDHFHQIIQGTVTEAAGTDKHVHRFSFVEGVYNASVAS